MKVIDVIDKCEELLEVDSTREDLLECYNVIESELAVDYLPLYATHQCDSPIVYYSEFAFNPLRIVGCNCKFKLYPEYISAEESIKSIQYAYSPNRKELYDECSYRDDALDCLVYGTVAEFLISQGFFEESIWWNKKYKKQIESLML